MKKIVRTIEQGHVGVFESPTGTGKSLSIITSALAWLKKVGRNNVTDQRGMGSSSSCTDQHNNKRGVCGSNSSNCRTDCTCKDSAVDDTLTSPSPNTTTSVSSEVHHHHRHHQQTTTTKPTTQVRDRNGHAAPAWLTALSSASKNTSSSSSKSSARPDEEDTEVLLSRKAMRKKRLKIIQGNKTV